MKLLCSAQEGIPTSQVAPPPQEWPELSKKRLIKKISRSALLEYPTGVILATNHSVFIKWPLLKLLVLKRGFRHHRVAPLSQKRPELTKKAQNQSQNTIKWLLNHKNGLN